MSIQLKTLIGKLNDTCRTGATRAANIAIGMGHGEVDVEHLLLALLEQPECDLQAIARRSDVSMSALEADLRRELAGVRIAATRVPVFARRLQLLLEHAWLISSLALPQPDQVRSCHLLLALLTESELSQQAARISGLFARFPVDGLKHRMEKYVAGSVECALPAATQDGAAQLAASAPAPALAQYTVNLCQLAREGKLDPVIGRAAEVRQLMDILLRRRQNNPILTGAAGVGKTAVVEGLALRIAAGQVPPPLRSVALHALDLALLQAGASVRGEFEARLKNVIDEVRRSPHPIVLFIDEAHTMIGAGGAAGQGDAANLLKPALARGELRTIAATTWSEYKRFFEKDAALARRFQVVKVEEPDEDTAAGMLRAMVPLMEQHFGVRVRDDAVTAAVRLAHRYINSRQLPDKAVGVLDTACARVALGQCALPALLEDAACQIERLSARIAALERDASCGAGAADARPSALPALRDERGSLQAWHAELAARHERERDLCARVLALRQQDDAGAAAEMQQQLQALQRETPLVPLEVDRHVVAGVVAAWTGIPVGRMLRDEIRTVQQLKPALESRVLGQPHAVESIVQRMRTARAGLDDPRQPKGIFLLTGPSGVGKTETALALADLLYGGERKLVTINMSEYQEPHSVAGLKGSPPGYVGYGEGGVLTEAVRRNPYCVVLLDEADKAHPDVLELFYQVFDRGVLEDAEGQMVDFSNTVIVLTANLGSGAIMQACLNRGAAPLPTPQELDALLRPHLARHFKPALLGRLQVLPYYPISDEALAQVIALKLGRVGQRISENHHAEFCWDDALVQAVLARCTETDSGARNIDSILHGSLLPGVADVLLARMAEGLPVAKVKVGVTRQGQFRITTR
ncbi:type VI secretion system ATPase TssH [Duganella sp. Root198D2]|uniref:type VI secretion system ATPase TssH n=1 Tax=Duganella sp. Root198D2 TaxID=1736489 RepID=UPI0007109BF4|nr:type VI secretion system ATPase TssH [Duganella sp. Root198D2]KRC03721.1 ClpV1 family T6SS ATPase [Duganella sp. Root198D2]